ncbi:MAG: HAMP domain-containing protein [Candidatus Marinimicrobia bacterium]|nr:HAMP domain-containing protein [Candidatus Neomarinimicrobiota bacterium]
MSSRDNGFSPPQTKPATIWDNLKRPNSLYGRLVILLSSMSLLLFVFLAWLIFSMSNNYLENVTKRCGKRMSTVIDHTIRSSMISEDHAELTEALAKVQGVPGVSAIRIYNDEGEIKHYSPGAMNSSHGEDSMLPCTHCHTSVDPGQWGMPETCVYNIQGAEGRTMIVLSPIMSTPECRSSGCHQTNDDSEVLGFMEIKLPLTELDKALSNILYEYFGIIMLFLLLLMATLLFFIERRVNRPLKRIVDVSQSVTAGNLSVRVDVSKNELRDVHQVGMALNTMLESINQSNREMHQWSNDLENMVRIKSEDIARSQNEIYQIERLASLGRLSSSVAHEINNPLAGVLTYAKLVSRILQNSELTEDRRVAILKHLDMIQSETTRCGNIVKGLLNFSMDSSQKFESLHVNEVLDETAQLIQHSFQISDVRLITDFSASRDQIKANGNQVIQACLAVLTNALEAVDEGGDGLVTYRSYNPDMKHVVIEIKDNGIGISAEDQEHMFEPFFSRKKEMSGIGLGLAVTYGILEQHNGKVYVDSAPGKGTSIKFKFELSNGGTEDGQ